MSDLKLDLVFPHIPKTLPTVENPAKILWYLIMISTQSNKRTKLIPVRCPRFIILLLTCSESYETWVAE